MRAPCVRNTRLYLNGDGSPVRKSAMHSFSHSDRSQSLIEMGENGVDVLVVGGGVTGAAVAMDAVSRGYRVGLLDKGDFAGETSSKSTKLIHGGIRYLPQFDFKLVHEALVERGLLFQNAPWIVKPLGFVLPLFSWNKRPLGAPVVPPFGIGMNVILESGLFLYDAFAGRLNVRRHSRISVVEAAKRAPALNSMGLRHAFVYYDGETDDARLTLAVLRTSAKRGARAANYVEVTGFEIEGNVIVAANAVDLLSGHSFVIRTRFVVNAAGVFAERVEALTGHPTIIGVEPAKGVHLLFKASDIPMTKHAVVLPETEDGRLLFLVPWGDRVLVGTTDTEGGDIELAQTSGDDVDYVLRQCNRYLKTPLSRENIISAFAGFRPLIKSKEAGKSTAMLSRSHAVVDGAAGMVSIVGGKLTTWRKMAEDAIDMVEKKDGRRPNCHTREMALDGTEEWVIAQNATKGLSPRVRAHLASAYGANVSKVLEPTAQDPSLMAPIVEGLPYLMAEVVYSVRYEMAMALADVLCRRTRIVIEDEAQGLLAAPRVANLMASELNWDSGEIERQLGSYRETVAREFRWLD